MGIHKETLGFCLLLAACLAGFFHDSLLGGKILSPADVLLVEASFRIEPGGDYEPANRLLMDPVLQFQPWLEFNRAMLRQGRLPLWNPHAGCGTPHLASGQSAVFDPFHLMAYLTDVPRALAWMAAGRLWLAGLGMFLLARAWGAGAWGRWFAGLVYPFCGFLILWLLYPVTHVAIWLPWLLLTTDRVVCSPGSRSAGLLAVVVGLVIIGGHIQTSAHLLLTAGVLALWRLAAFPSWRERSRRLLVWGSGIFLGVALAGVQIVPLGYYLARSPVWGDRQREAQAWWTIEKPRLLDAACTTFPYAFGSQRRGHPNIARGLGVHNLNESAGGYAGLATLIWLAPLAFQNRRRHPEIRFLIGLTAFGALAAFRLPPVDNLLRALPVLSVTDNRRLLLWVAFGLCMLGGFGIDALARGARLGQSWLAAWLIGALVMVTIAASAPWLEPVLRDRASRHYQASAGLVQGIDPMVLQARAEHQVKTALAFIPRYYGLAACELLLLVGLAWAQRRGILRSSRLASIVFCLTLAELGGFGIGLNPAIEPGIQQFEPPVIAMLRAGLGPGQRALGIGQELPPNVLMRFGLDDPRNYDSVELATSLKWLEPLYEPGPEALSSRREITWEGVHRARGRLEQSCVAAVVGATPPPAAWFPRVDRAGDVWIVWLAPARWASAGPTTSVTVKERQPGAARVLVRGAHADQLVLRESWVPGWKAWIDGTPVPVGLYPGAFLQINIQAGEHSVAIAYHPMEVFYGLLGSAVGAIGVILALTGVPQF
jgi:hypothetical protein